MAIEYLRNESHHGKNAQLSDYILRQGQYAEKGENDFIFGGYGNMPSWAKNPHDFWNAADASEARNQAAREKRNGKKEKEMIRRDEAGKHIIIALPRNFDNEELKNLSDELARKIAGNDHVYTWGVHVNNGALSNEKNPHLHIFICTRKIDRNRKEPDEKNYFRKTRSCRDGTVNGGYHKDDEIVGAHRTKWTEKKKQEFQEICNKHIRKHNETHYFDKENEIDFAAKKGSKAEHLGKKAIARAAKGEQVKKVQKELNRRTKKLIDKSNDKLYQVALEYGGELTLGDMVTIAAKKWIKSPLNATERQKIGKWLEMDKMSDRAPNPSLFNEEMSKNRIENIKEIREMERRFNEGLEKTAEERGKTIKSGYKSIYTKELNETYRKDEEKIAKIKEKREEDEAQKEWREGRKKSGKTSDDGHFQFARDFENEYNKQKREKEKPQQRAERQRTRTSDDGYFQFHLNFETEYEKRKREEEEAKAKQDAEDAKIAAEAVRRARQAQQAKEEIKNGAKRLEEQKTEEKEEQKMENAEIERAPEKIEPPHQPEPTVRRVVKKKPKDRGFSR